MMAKNHFFSGRSGIYCVNAAVIPWLRQRLLKAGMWITADFRLYPPVITANQELVSPTGDHLYRGGTERAHPRGCRV